MLRRGIIVKADVTKHRLDNKLVLERKTLATRHVLKLDDDRCVGCGICEAICPKEAPKLSPPTTRDGRLVQKPRIDFEADKCVFCGECVDLCPTNALRMEINGEQRLPIFEVEAFPTLRKVIAIDAKKCWYGAITAACDLECQKECPTEAIDVTVKSIGEESAERIVDFRVREEECIFCKKCENACSEGAIQVIKPFRGTLQLDTSLCPEGCQVCADACPTKAISIDKDKKLVITKEFCIYCGACQQVCPEEAIKVDRTQVLHTDVKSGAWVKALEKLTSYKSLVKEIGCKSGDKRYIRVKNLTGS
ncbi:4Fe-4S dicluster domain-containing protein [Candidatus Bathyarchaeota archaeon]|nr:4Fe-4S dicluster domain-containing protein [Candidatus Bathyarchaeota archaeon]